MPLTKENRAFGTRISDFLDTGERKVFFETFDELKEAMNHVYRDLKMLQSGEWVPDKHSIEATIDQLTIAIDYLENCFEKKILEKNKL